MTTLEEEVLLPLQRQISAQSASNGHDRPARATSRFWFYFLIVSFSFLFSMSVTALVQLKNQAGDRWKQALSQFNWLVLSEGDQVAIDEIGRYLGKIDGVADVSFVSSDETYAKLKNDPVFSQDLSLLPSNPFPACWKVSWKNEAFNASKIQDSLQDVRMFPGVIDVASDPKALQAVHSARASWYRLRQLLAVLSTAFILFLFVGMAKLLFFADKKIDWKKGLAGTVVSVLSAAAGVASVFGLW